MLLQDYALLFQIVEMESTAQQDQLLVLSSNAQHVWTGFIWLEAAVQRFLQLILIVTTDLLYQVTSNVLLVLTTITWIQLSTALLYRIFILIVAKVLMHQEYLLVMFVQPITIWLIWIFVLLFPVEMQTAKQEPYLVILSLALPVLMTITWPPLILVLPFQLLKLIAK